MGLCDSACEGSLHAEPHSPSRAGGGEARRDRALSPNALLSEALCEGGRPHLL